MALVKPSSAALHMSGSKFQIVDVYSLVEEFAFNKENISRIEAYVKQNI